MATLTGIQNGTNGDDQIIGSESIAENSLEQAFAIAVAEGVDQAVIQAKAGNDTIRGTATADVGPEQEGVATATGIKDSTVVGATGQDEIVATGTARDLQGGGSADGYGVRNATISANSGDDTLSFSGSSQSNATSGSGVIDSQVSAGVGDDAITIVYDTQGTADAATFPDFVVGSGSGIRGSNVVGNEGSDTINVSVTGQQVFLPGQPLSDNNVNISGAVGGARVKGGQDNDTIDFSVEVVESNRATTAGLDNARAVGDEGNDTLTLNVKSLGLILADSVGVKNNSQLRGGDGNDAIRISIEASSGGPLASETTAVGVKDSYVAGDAGADTIEIAVLGGSVDRGTGIGAENALIAAGSGDDVVEIKAEGSGNASGVSFGLLNSRLNGGLGDDRINIEAIASGEDSILGDATGASESAIFAGEGNDSITIKSSVGFGSVDINDVVLGGGAGDDSFDVGVGSGFIDGGSGADVAVVDYLETDLPDGAEISVFRTGSGVKIVSNLDNFGLGRAETWTQRFVGVETFKVGSTTYSIDELIATFG